MRGIWSCSPATAMWGRFPPWWNATGSRLSVSPGRSWGNRRGRQRAGCLGRRLAKISGLKHPEAFTAWLLRIVARRSFRRAAGNPAGAADGGRWRPGSGSRVGDRDRGCGADPSRLAPRQRAVMHLTVIDGMTDSEIAAALGITAASVALTGGARGKPCTAC